MAFKLRRGTDAERLTITPAEGELIYVTDTKKLFVGDGSTVGGTDVADFAPYATIAYVNQAVNDLIGGAQETLDTLKELADAIGGDDNFATNILTQLAAKANSADLAAVATTGNYSDLLNTPALFSGAYGDLTGAPTLSTVATSGDYGDLTNKPDLSVYQLASSAFSGDYGDLTNKPDLSVKADLSYVDSALNILTTAIDYKVNTADIATVATSGDYNDLINKPTIPADIGDLTDVGGLLGGGGSGGGTGGDPAYNGFKAHYGRMWGNTSDPNGPINKIVIYKDVGTPTSTIDESTSNDTFNVSGLAGSDIVAMLVVVGKDINQTPTAELKTFAESVIDNVILSGWSLGDIPNVADMKNNFYNNYSTFASLLTDRKTNLEFFDVNTQFSITPQFATPGGANLYSLSYNMDNDTISLGSWSNGTGHNDGDVFVIPGTQIQDANSNFLASPDNDVTVTVLTTNSGYIQDVSVVGTLPRPAEVWPSNYINDGGDDEYDNANYINTNLENEISYNNGLVVTGSSAFGGGDYVVTYKDGIFGVFAVGASIDSLGTSGNSGFDGDGQADTGSLYGAPAGPATGDITFTGTALLSENGTGPWYNGVISLKPGSANDTVYDQNGQFINIFPTWDYDQPHIHIAAGTGSSGTGDLILGPDEYHIDINHDGNVYIKTDNQNYTWTFNDSGDLIIPGGIRDASGNSVLGGGSMPRASVINTPDPDVTCGNIRVMMTGGVVTVREASGNGLTVVYSGRTVSASGTQTIISTGGASVNPGDALTLGTLANRGDSLIMDYLYDANSNATYRINVMVTWSSLPYGGIIIEQIA